MPKYVTNDEALRRGAVYDDDTPVQRYVKPQPKAAPKPEPKAVPTPVAAPAPAIDDAKITALIVKAIDTARQSASSQAEPTVEAVLRALKKNQSEMELVKNAVKERRPEQWDLQVVRDKDGRISNVIAKELK